MAVIHLKGLGGNDANDGSTWALGKASMIASSNVDGTGNTVYCDSGSSELVTASQTFTGGTADSPMTWISGVPGASVGVTSATKGYSVAVQGGSYSLSFYGVSSFYGLSFALGSSTFGVSALMGQTARARQTFSSCEFVMVGTGSGARITVGVSSSTDGQEVVWNDVGVRFAAAGQSITVQNATLTWDGGSVLPTSVSPTALFGSGPPAGRTARITMSGVDLSLLNSGFLFMNNPTGQFDLLVRGCRLPSGWSGNVVGGTVSDLNYRVAVIDCDSDNNGYVKFVVQDPKGRAEQETTVDRTGSGDGISDYSIKITGAKSKFPGLPFVTHEQFVWNSVVGVPRKMTIELASNSTLTNQEIAVRARYYGSSGSPQMSVVSSVASPEASAANLTTSAASWNGSPTNKYKIELTFTPWRAGYVVWEVLSFTTKTAYVDPKPTLANA